MTAVTIYRRRVRLIGNHPFRPYRKVYVVSVRKGGGGVSERTFPTRGAARRFARSLQP
jgi:hypothetical protein